MSIEYKICKLQNLCAMEVIKKPMRQKPKKYWNHVPLQFGDINFIRQEQ